MEQHVEIKSKDTGANIDIKETQVESKSETMDPLTKTNDVADLVKQLTVAEKVCEDIKDKIIQLLKQNKKE